MSDFDYNAYLRSTKWRTKRKAALRRAEHRCQLCYGTQRLQAHHRTYDRIGNEKASDLTVLCEDCHAVFHAKLALKPMRPPKRGKQKARAKRTGTPLKAIQQADERDRKRMELRRKEYAERRKRQEEEHAAVRASERDLEVFLNKSERRRAARRGSATESGSGSSPDASTQ